MKQELWQDWEDDVADALGLDKVKASGQTWLHKGDSKGNGLLVDAKETQTDGYAVTEKFWKEQSTWARNEGKEPVIAIRIEDDNGPIEIAVVSELLYAEMHPGWEPEDQLKKQKQRKLTRKAAGRKPTSFLIGKYRLVAYSFSKFCEEIE